ncbi:MAG: glutamate synthase large subunit [Alphaproteobacteria bacterium]|nr:glutamate synthase large subunit [Rhodospirillales bacterium]MCW9045871.1 glutamate synthase large subunit [Alphaproteobacteria bacterium]
MNFKGLPSKRGLYDPINEHDACGIGFVADIKGRKSHKTIQQGLEILANLTHRGAVGADPLAGDGAGILIQIPDAYMREEFGKQGVTLPAVGDYAIGMVFLSKDPEARKTCEDAIEKYTLEEGQTFLGWRDLEVNSNVLGESVKKTEPTIRQFAISRGANIKELDEFQRKLLVIRKQTHRRIDLLEDNTLDDFYIVSLDAITLLYKGMTLADRVDLYYSELKDERMVSALAMVHQRFSTNTFPSWRLAQPFRMICHNGEINTLRGNINWMAARRQTMESELLGDDLEKLWPLIPEGQSDSACFDNALELLVAGGYSLAHAMMLLIPEAWDGNPLMDDERKAFYEYHSALMEPWDGPAAVAFSDGRQIGATLDRNGLRPARYVITDDDCIILASEEGVLDIPEKNIVKRWRLQPGKMLLIDLEKGTIIDDSDLKTELAKAKPYKRWLEETQMKLEDLPAEVSPMAPDNTTLLKRQQAFGYTQEDIKYFLEPMSLSGMDPVGSMGHDAPLAVLSNKSRLLYDYFKQNFAQVTNPPIDPIREELVMSLVSHVGPRPNLLGINEAGQNMRLEVRQPILTNADIEKIRHIENYYGGAFKTTTLDMCFEANEGAEGLEPALKALCQRAQYAVNEGYNIIVLSDRNVGLNRIPIPAALATSAVHHYLVRKGLRTSTGLVIETGEAREVHHFAVLAGYGAEAINPYLAFDTLTALRPSVADDMTDEDLHNRYVKAVGKGMLKVMSKMGISTYQSYCGAQIFDGVGLHSDFVKDYFTGTATTIEGVGIKEISEESVRRHQTACDTDQVYKNALDVGGFLAYRLRGEEHMWTPESIGTLQHAVRSSDYGKYKEYARMINEQDKRLMNLRGLFTIKKAAKPVPLDEVEAASEIVKRFATGAMSYGSISHEAHTNLAIAMNRIGGKSNSGEGGEERDRFKKLPNGDWMRSAIKQVASGRFGVTTEYLVNAADIQIKMAQGAKPGEGGQLPGHKVNQTIARVRHSTPGVGLISPPPHHDIYSIEDLAQLIHDLKNVNPEARVSVKLVSEVGVGTVAAGVSKAHADHVTISGYDGGTGASPITSIKHAGSPWEIGLAETHQTLVLNELRGRISVQVDGGLRSGRDVIVGALLGADEFGFATGALIAEGCIMMRKCHLNTCPVGVATQDEELRKRFTGKPEDVVNFMMYMAEEAREIMAEMGFRTFNEMIGRSDMLEMNEAISHWKSAGLDYSKILHKPEVSDDVAIHWCETQDHGLDAALDNELIKQAKPALEKRTPVQIETPIKNYNRTAGAMLSGEVARRFGLEGLPEDTISIKFKGIAGQSFGAFLMQGVTAELAGAGNDYVGKGLSGGRIVIYPDPECPITPTENIIAGNTLLYGAISGECFLGGVAGERFAVRNSGAVAVVEGLGDHGCEYMTGGCVVVLGQTGRNFAAGMSGGVAYVLDEEGDFDRRCNMAMVEFQPILDEADALEEHDHQGRDLETKGKVDLMRDMTRFDAQRLKMLIEKHMHYTNSDRARDILDNWESYLPKFVKVMPVEYRRALMEMQADKAKNPVKPNLGRGR